MNEVPSPTWANKLKQWLVLMPLITLLVGFAAGYGGSKYAEGARNAEFEEVKRQAVENRHDLNKVIDNSITRREQQLFIDESRRNWEEILKDIRELRK